jgi:hypothetical protein
MTTVLSFDSWATRLGPYNKFLATLTTQLQIQALAADALARGQLVLPRRKEPTSTFPASGSEQNHRSSNGTRLETAAPAFDNSNKRWRLALTGISSIVSAARPRLNAGPLVGSPCSLAALPRVAVCRFGLRRTGEAQATPRGILALANLFWQKKLAWH